MPAVTSAGVWPSLIFDLVFISQSLLEWCEDARLHGCAAPAIGLMQYLMGQVSGSCTFTRHIAPAGIISPGAQRQNLEA